MIGSQQIYIYICRYRCTRWRSKKRHRYSLLNEVDDKEDIQMLPKSKGQLKQSTCHHWMWNVLKYHVAACFCYTLGLKGPTETSRNQIVHLFVRNSVLLTYKMQYLKFERSYSNETWTVGSLPHWHHMPLGVGRVKM